jgi:predicted glycosyltransferase
MYNAHVGKLIGKPCIVFTDTEYTKYGNFVTFPFMSAICTPNNFNVDLGSKHIRYRGYHELAYLWPKYFQPDPSILDELKVGKDEKFVIMRFVAFKAHHDIGVTGVTLENKIKAVEKLSKYAKVFISSESKLPKKLDKYRFHLPSEKFQNALFYAYLYFADSQTTTTEAACLGTPAIRCNTFACSPQERSNFVELEERYGLIKNFNVKDQEKAIDMAFEWVKKENLKNAWVKKRQKLLKDKIDVTAFMTWFIEEYPNSYEIMKNNPNYQRRFK